MTNPKRDPENAVRDLFLHGFTTEDFVDEDLVENVVARANQLFRARLAEAQVVYVQVIEGKAYDVEFTSEATHKARLVAIEALEKQEKT